MSWDISVCKLPDVASIEDIPEDFQCDPMGSRADVIAQIQAVAPEADFSDPSWGILEGQCFSIEFNMGSEEVCEDFMLHVRDGGDAVKTIEAIVSHLKVRAIDCSSGEFFNAPQAQESFEQWQGYRDRFVGG